MDNIKGLRTSYKDCAVPYQNPKESDGTSFGEQLEGAPAPESGGEWGTGVQMATVAGGEPGKKNFVKIPGSGGEKNSY